MEDEKMRYKIATYEDFKAMLKDRAATAVYLSRQLFEDTTPVEIPDPEKKDGPALKSSQLILAGYLVIVAELAPTNQGIRDTIKYIHPFSPFPTDRSQKRNQDIQKAITEIEMSIIKDLEVTLEKRPMFYSGEIEEDDQALLSAINRISAVLMRRP
jgi:hypothetical protein